MLIDPRKGEGFERLESAAAAALERAKKDPNTLRTECDRAVLRHEHATGEYYSPHPLGCEYELNAGPGVLTEDAASAAYDFGFDSAGRLRTMVAHPPKALSVRSSCTWYEDDLELTVSFEEGKHCQNARAVGVLVCWRDPCSPTILVVGLGSALYREVIDLSETGRARVWAAASHWRNFGVLIEYDVQLDENGRTRLVSCGGRELYSSRPPPSDEAVARMAHQYLRILTHWLVTTSLTTPAVGIVAVHGHGQEGFPPYFYLLSEEYCRHAEGRLDQYTPDALEVADGVTDHYPESGIVDADRQTTFRMAAILPDLLRRFVTVDWPLPVKPIRAFMYDTEEGVLIDLLAPRLDGL